MDIIISHRDPLLGKEKAKSIKMGSHFLWERVDEEKY